MGCARASIGNNSGDDGIGSGLPDGDNAGPDAPADASIDAPPPPPGIDAAFVTTLQQTVDTTIAANGTFGCNNGNETFDQSFYRAFSLADHNIANRPFYVQYVSFAVQQASGGTSALVKIGAYSGSLGQTTLNPAQITAINSASVAIPLSNMVRPITVPITATIPANSQFVVEVFNPTNPVGSGRFVLMGRTASAELAGRATYYKSADCGPVSPTVAAQVPPGFPNTHVIITVTGQY